MAITNGYITLAELKSYMKPSIGDSSDDTELEYAVEAASRMIDQHCRRRFYADTSATARTYRAEWVDKIYVDDISTLTGLLVSTDTTDNGTFDRSWTVSTDFEMEPLQAIGPGGETWAYTTIRAVGTSYRFPTGGRRPRVQVTATWGWPAVPDAVRQACFVQSARLFRRAGSPEGVIGGFVSDVGPIRVGTRLDPDVAMLLTGYVANPVRV